MTSVQQTSNTDCDHDLLDHHRAQPFCTPQGFSNSMARPDFDRFVAESADGLLRTAYLMVGDLQEAEDVVQETLLKVAKRWPRVSRMDYPTAYARQILVNLALRGSPKRSRRQAELSEAWLGDTPAPTVAIERDDELHTALAALPPRQRAVLVLRYFLDLPEAEVATALQCSLGTVKSTASRGLSRLERTLRAPDGTNSRRSVAS
jgi:RNA polymerase sigma-70 factor (sigma-E family)